jgi:hypothetical protein
MAFSSLCRSDPLLDFIRATYGAIPLRVPDQRFQPLALFTVQERRARYLGTLSELAVDPAWSTPRTSSSELGQVSGTTSNQIAWSAAADLLGPFISNVLGIDLAPVKAGLKGASRETEGVRIAIGPTRRTMVNPLAISHAIEGKVLRLPATTELDFGREGGQALYVIDCVFVARELSLELIGSKARDAAANLEAKLVAKVKASQMLRASSKLTVLGSNRTPFAFTCLRMQATQDGFVEKILLGDASPRLNATPVDSVANVAHADLGDTHELLAFDE